MWNSGSLHCFSKSDARFSSSMLYYGLSLNVGSFGLNIFLTQFIFGIVEIPAVLSNLVVSQRLGRRLSQAGFLFFGGVACLSILVIPKGAEFHLVTLKCPQNNICTIDYISMPTALDLFHSLFRPSSGGYHHRCIWEIFCLRFFQHGLCFHSRTLSHHIKVSSP